jgi:hypothetical protein
VRVNTEFHSWDTSFGFVNPRLRYSCSQVVFCVNLGTFFKCFLQLRWRLTGVRSIHTERSLSVTQINLFSSLNIPSTFHKSVCRVPHMSPQRFINRCAHTILETTLRVPQFGVLSSRNVSLNVVLCVNLSPYLQVILAVRGVGAQGHLLYLTSN